MGSQKDIDNDHNDDGDGDDGDDGKVRVEASKSSRKSLLVNRFVPGGAEKPKESSGLVKDGVANVNPFFARLFRGGPQREASFLPAGEDEGKEATVEEVKQITTSVEAGADDWLSSIGGEAAPEAPAAKEDDEEEDDMIASQQRDDLVGDGTLSWLKSIGAVMTSSKIAATDPTAIEIGRGRKRQHELSAAAKMVVGKALEVQPFWRTASNKTLEKDLLENREAFLEHSRRLVKDSRRLEKKQGRLAFRKRRVV
mmetsp:Transcript_21425/g.32069  ORF Transcript_21425/g.32069 Transcript_21425/m.32069 type:complete len:254 (+) Transcript_21425:140-901(+)